MKKVLERVKNIFKSVKNALFSVHNKIKNRFNSFIMKHPEINRLKTLTSMQIYNSKRLRKAKSTKDKILYSFLKILLFVGLIVLFRLVFWLVDSFLFGPVLMRLEPKHISFVFLIFIALSILEITSDFTYTLYKGKDNIILLSYPVKASEVFASKLLVKYIKELKKMVYFIVPMFAGFYLFKSSSFDVAIYFLRVLAIFLLEPFIVVLISATLSVLFILVDYIFKRVPILRILFLIILIFGIFGGVLTLVNILPSRLPLKELWLTILQNFSAYLDNSVFNSVADYFCFGLGKVDNIWLLWLIVSSILIGIVLFVLFICFPLFFRLSSSAVEINSSKKYKYKDVQEKNMFFVFLKKELKTYLRSDDNVLTTFMYLLILPLLLFCLNRIFNVLDISELGSVLIMCINLLISIVLLSASNVSAASAISREGSEFYLMKIAPADTKMICFAKMTINIILSFLSIIGVGIALANVEFVSLQSTIFICLILVFVNIGHICWSIELDIMNPKIDQNKAGEEVINDNPNVSLSIVLGLVIAAVFTFLAYFFFSKYPSNHLETWIRLLILAILFCGARISIFIIKLKTHFDDISI